MKARLLFFTLLFSLLVSTRLIVLADGEHDSGGGSEHCGDGSGDHHSGHDEGDDGEGDDEDGGDIDGTESLDARVILVATTNAPSSAIGCAKLEVENENGTVTATLAVKTRGLDAGDYTLSAILQSDGSSVNLGTITITNDSGSGVLVSQSEVTLPSDLNPLDIGQVILSDANGNAVLVGDLVNPAKGSLIKFKASLKVKSRNSAARSGTTQALSTITSSRRAQKFAFTAAGVAARTNFKVHVNGNLTGVVKSNSKGQVAIKNLPVDVMKLRTVRLTDDRGTVAASARY